MFFPVQRKAHGTGSGRRLQQRRSAAEKARHRPGRPGKRSTLRAGATFCIYKKRPARCQWSRKRPFPAEISRRSRRVGRPVCRRARHPPARLPARPYQRAGPCLRHPLPGVMIDTFHNRQKRSKVRSGSIAVPACSKTPAGQKARMKKVSCSAPVTALSGTAACPLPQKPCGREHRA